MVSTSPNRLVQLVCACIVFFVPVLGLAIGAGAQPVTASAPTMNASGTPREGKGFAMPGGDFVGYYVTDAGRKLYCLSPHKALPDNIDLHRSARYPGLDRVSSAKLAYALGRWGDPGTDNAAAAESQVLNTIVGNVADVQRRAHHLPRQVAATTRRHLKLAARFHGPYDVALHTSRAALPGQRARGTVTVTAASGVALRNITVKLSASRNARVTGQVTTNSYGIGHFRYRVRDIGEVHIAAIAQGLPAMSLYRNHPDHRTQHMISPVHPVKAHASASFRAAPGGLAHRYACTTTCNGRPTTTVRACSAASHRASRLVIDYGTHSATLKFPAGRHRSCLSRPIVMRDGQQVAAHWQYRTRHGWSMPVRADGSFRVDCPRVPSVAVSLTADCTKATLRIDLAARAANGTSTPLVNPSRHRMVLLVGGAATERLIAGHGQTAVFTAHVSCTAARTYTWRAGVQRDSGAYNYGPQGSVTTPGPTD